MSPPTLMTPLAKSTIDSGSGVGAGMSSYTVTSHAVIVPWRVAQPAMLWTTNDREAGGPSGLILAGWVF